MDDGAREDDSGQPLKHKNGRHCELASSSTVVFVAGLTSSLESTQRRCMKAGMLLFWSLSSCKI